jgi:prevent-host-death family protein
MSAERPLHDEVTIHEAKTHLSRLVARAEAGEEIVLKRGRTRVAKLVPLSPPKPKRRVPGRYAEEGVTGILDDGFWDPLPADHLGLTMRDRYTP